MGAGLGKNPRSPLEEIPGFHGVGGGGRGARAKGRQVPQLGERSWGRDPVVACFSAEEDTRLLRGGVGEATGVEVRGEEC